MSRRLSKSVGATATTAYAGDPGAGVAVDVAERAVAVVAEELQAHCRNHDVEVAVVIDVDERAASPPARSAAGRPAASSRPRTRRPAFCTQHASSATRPSNEQIGLAVVVVVAGDDAPGRAVPTQTTGVCPVEAPSVVAQEPHDHRRQARTGPDRRSPSRSAQGHMPAACRPAGRCCDQMLAVASTNAHRRERRIDRARLGARRRHRFAVAALLADRLRVRDAVRARREATRTAPSRAARPPRRPLASAPSRGRMRR